MSNERKRGEHSEPTLTRPWTQRSTCLQPDSLNFQLDSLNKEYAWDPRLHSPKMPPPLLLVLAAQVKYDVHTLDKSWKSKFYN